MAPDLLALYDALPPDERATLDAALAESPELREAAASWDTLRAGVRAELARSLPDRALLVLYALADDPDLLTGDERERLEASGVAEAVGRHPGLAAAVRRLRADRDAFESAWAEHASGAEADGQEVPAERPRRVRAEDRLQQRAPSREAVARVPARQRPSRWIWRGASVAAVAAFVGLLSFLYVRDADFKRIHGGEDGELVAFADGSEAELAPGAILMVPRESAADIRQARLLTGSALFDIERDPANPFEVQTPNADVTVLGTTFGVEVEGEGAATRVVLASGRVQVAPREQPDKAVTLEPGQATRVAALEAPEAPRSTDVASDLAWTGTLYARELSAAEVARRISVATGLPVTVDADLAGEAVSGTFHVEDGPEPVLQTLALALGADLLRTPDGGFRLAR